MTSVRPTNNGIDVLNTSVTELMILGIFFVLLAFAIARQDLSGALSSADDLQTQLAQQLAEVSRLQARIEALKKTVGVSKSELEETLFQRKRRIDDLTQQLEELTSTNSQLAKSLAEAKLQLGIANQMIEDIRAEREDLKNKIDATISIIGSDEEFEQSINSIRRIAAANNIDPNAPLNEVITALEQRIGTLSSSVSELRHQNEELRRKFGIDVVEAEKLSGEIITARCWTPDGERPDALFDISIRSDGFSVAKAWPNVREYDATSSETILAMVRQGNLSESEFRTLGRKIRAESEKRQPPCIFVVNVHIDEIDTPSAIQFKKLRNVAGLSFYIR